MSATAYVVRHADAGDRTTWKGDDALRPLSDKGRWQAGVLPGLLGIQTSIVVLSSPAVRCVETVEPLAAAVGSAVVTESAAAEGMGAAGLRRLITESAADLVVCSHGDVIGALIWELSERGLVGADARFQKASTWRLRCGDGEIIEAVYIPPPKRESRQ